MGEFRAVVWMEADQRQQFADAVGNRRLALDQAEGADRLGDDAADAPARVERGVGVLKDHLDAPAQALALIGRGRIAHRDAVDGDRAGRGRQQADDHARHGRFARAGFADEREGLALADVEGDAVDRLEILPWRALQHAVEPGLRDVEDALEIADLDERGGIGSHAATSLSVGWS